MYSKHPFEPFIPAKATKLIIGTIPPTRFCINIKSKRAELLKEDVDFYYGSRDNSFWDLLGKVFEIEFAKGDKGLEQRKKFLVDRNIGITDIIDSFERINESASDEDLMNISYKDLKTILNKKTEVNTLIYTSEFVKTKINEMFLAYHTIDKTDKKKQTVKLQGKVYNVWILYSPSPQALINMGSNGAEKRLEQYKKVFTK